MARPIWPRRSWSASFAYQLVKRLEEEEAEEDHEEGSQKSEYRDYDDRFFFRDI